MFPRRIPDGVDTAIQDARNRALRAGRLDVVSHLEAVLTTGLEPRASRIALDVLSGEVKRCDTLIPLSRGERALLTVLALQKRPCTREELIEHLYPHLGAASAASALKVYVHRVRRKLCDPLSIVYQSDRYRLGPNVTVDLWEVEAEVAEALGAQGAMSSEGLERLETIRSRLSRRVISCVDDREWAARLERRLRALDSDLSSRLGEVALASGDVAAALRLAAELIDTDPCDERGVELAIRAHLLVGDRGAARRNFRLYERVLKADLDLSPSRELVALVGM